MSKRIYIDFDGVLHQYPKEIYENNKLRNLKPREIVGEPVKGSIEFLKRLLCSDPVKKKEYEVCIFSGRSYSFGARKAMKNWLRDNGLETYATKLKFPLFKRPSHVTLDDRVMLFSGKFPSIDKLFNFTPWTYKN